MKKYGLTGMIFLLICLSGCKEKKYTSLHQENLIGDVKSVTVTSQEGDFYDHSITTTVYHYNKEGYLVEKKMVYTSFGSMESDPADLDYTIYDNLGKVAVSRDYRQEEKIYHIEGNQSSYSDESFLYDENNLLVKSVSEYATSHYTYKDGKLVQVTQLFHEPDVEWGDQLEYTYEYDKNGNVIKETSPVEVRTYIYEDYDEKGNWTIRAAIIKNEQRGYEMLLESRKISYYSDEEVETIPERRASEEQSISSGREFREETIRQRESAEKERQDNITFELLKIEKELRDAVDQLAELQQQPMLSHGDILNINLQKQNIVRCFDNAINLSKKAGDYKLVTEYEQRKEKAIRAMQAMER